MAPLFLLNYDCRCLVRFVRDAEEMYPVLGYESADDLIRRGYELEPEEIHLAVRWLELNEPEVAVGLPEGKAKAKTAAERTQEAAVATTGEVLPRGGDKKSEGAESMPKLGIDLAQPSRASKQASVGPSNKNLTLWLAEPPTSWPTSRPARLASTPRASPPVSSKRRCPSTTCAGPGSAPRPRIAPPSPRSSGPTWPRSWPPPDPERRNPRATVAKAREQLVDFGEISKLPRTTGLACSAANGFAPEQPAKVAGKDGKAYPAAPTRHTRHDRRGPCNWRWRRRRSVRLLS